MKATAGRLTSIGAAVAILVSAPANAHGIAPYVRPQPEAPVQLLGCSAGIDFVSNRWGTSFSRLNTSVDFRNSSSRTAVAVLFRLQLGNAFGDVMDELFDQATGQFSSGATIRGNHWSNTDTWPGLGIIQCNVDRVLFSDGSVWNEQIEQPSPSPRAAPSSSP